jgi:metal-responsive CopG/Arc/MetJ family transcriptional regulator
MKVKTSITLSADVMAAVNEFSTPSSRSEFIEKAVRSYLAQQERVARNRRDLQLINRNAARLNREAQDVLAFQGEL